MKITVIGTGYVGLIEKQTERELQKEYVKAQLGDVETTYANTSLLTC